MPTFDTDDHAQKNQIVRPLIVRDLQRTQNNL
jgi:hypothetical protein